MLFSKKAGHSGAKVTYILLWHIYFAFDKAVKGKKSLITLFCLALCCFFEVG